MFTPSTARAISRGAARASATPATTPAAPTGLTALPGDDEMTLRWNAPTDNGGNAIRGYYVAYHMAGVANAVTLTIAAGGGGARNYVLTGLTNGVTYEFSVAASNEVGLGDLFRPRYRQPNGAGGGAEKPERRRGRQGGYALLAAAGTAAGRPH